MHAPLDLPPRGRRTRKGERWKWSGPAGVTRASSVHEFHLAHEQMHGRIAAPAVRGAPASRPAHKTMGAVPARIGGDRAQRMNGHPTPLGGPMSSVAPHRPMLIFFTSEKDGRCRRAEGFLAQVLQRRRNHETFVRRTVAKERRPDLLDRFRIERTPTLVVVDEQVVRGKLVEPRGCEEIHAFLAPWLK